MRTAGLFLYKRRLSGLAVMAAGAVIFVLVYRFWLPQYIVWFARSPSPA